VNEPRAISSRQNPVVEELRELRDASTDSEWVFLEGFHLLEEALKSGLAIVRLAFIPDLLNNPLIQKAITVAHDTVQITPYVMKSVSDVESPQGVVAVARKPVSDWEAIFSRLPKPIVILDTLQDPGNAATIIRTAEAAGAAGIVTTPGTARLFAPKALRSAMGSSLRLPVLEHVGISDIVEESKKTSIQLVGTKQAASITAYNEFNWKQPVAIILGQEARGISSEWPHDKLAWISIPMEPTVESLNVAAAAAVLLFMARQAREP
jgi:TrmH family RNA methyltransferase